MPTEGTRTADSPNNAHPNFFPNSQRTHRLQYQSIAHFPSQNDGPHGTAPLPREFERRRSPFPATRESVGTLELARDGALFLDVVVSLEQASASKHALERTLENAQAELDLIGRHGERGNQAHDLKHAGGHDHHPAVETLLGDVAGASLGAVPLEFDPDHQTESAHLGNGIAVADLGESVPQLAAACTRVIQNALFLEDVESGVCGGARDGVAGISAALATRGCLGHDVLACDNGRQRKPGCKALCHDENVGDDVVVLDGKHLARAAEARLHLIGDKENAILFADLLDAREKVGRRVDIATLSKHGLNHGTRSLLRGALLVQKKLKLLHTIVRHLRAGEAIGQLAGVGEGRHVHARHQWPKARAVDRLGCGHGHCANGAAMVRALEDNDIGLASGQARRFDGCLDGFGSRVPKVERIKSLGNDLEKFVGESDHLVMEGKAALPVDERCNLLLRSLDNARMAVASVGDTNAACEIEDLLALVGDNPAALAALHDDIAEAADARRYVAQTDLRKLRWAKAWRSLRVCEGARGSSGSHTKSGRGIAKRTDRREHFFRLLKLLLLLLLLSVSFPELLVPS
eukprot:Opistho-2@49321